MDKQEDIPVYVFSILWCFKMDKVYGSKESNINMIECVSRNFYVGLEQCLETLRNSEREEFRKFYIKFRSDKEQLKKIQDRLKLDKFKDGFNIVMEECDVQIDFVRMPRLLD